jgi:hypothetical protein
MKVIPPHALDADNHLDAVIDAMRGLGAPVIKAVWDECYGLWIALEGSHRLVAAQALGLTPVIEPVEYDDDTTTDDVAPGSYQDNHNVADIVADACRRAPLTY